MVTQAVTLILEKRPDEGETWLTMAPERDKIIFIPPEVHFLSNPSSSLVNPAWNQLIGRIGADATLVIADPGILPAKSIWPSDLLSFFSDYLFLRPLFLIEALARSAPNQVSTVHIGSFSLDEAYGISVELGVAYQMARAALVRALSSAGYPVRQG